MQQIKPKKVKSNNAIGPLILFGFI